MRSLAHSLQSVNERPASDALIGSRSLALPPSLPSPPPPPPTPVSHPHPPGAAAYEYIVFSGAGNYGGATLTGDRLKKKKKKISSIMVSNGPYTK